MKKVKRIESVSAALPRRKKVAAYACVSGDTERLMHSVSAQISHYSAFIQNNPEWEYAGVYADCGISGTDTAKRGAEMERRAAMQNPTYPFTKIHDIPGREHGIPL